MNHRLLSRYVVISQELRSWVQATEIPDSVLRWAADPAECFFSLLQPDLEKDQHALFVFFLPLPDVERVYNLVKNVDAETVTTRIIAFCEGSVPPRGSYNGTYDLRNTLVSPDEYLFKVHQLFTRMTQDLMSAQELDRNMTRLLDTRNDQEALINIGKSLSVIKNKDKLLHTILYFSKKITGADAGSIFLVVGEGDEKKLRFSYSHTYSMQLPYQEFTMPLDSNSIAGYVAITGNVLNIPDVYKLSAEDPVSFNASFDKEYGYITRSMLVVPMRNHVDEVTGIIQLINSKEYRTSEKGYTGNEAFEIVLRSPEDFDRYVVPFERRYEGLMEAVASQAAVAMENNDLVARIQGQFEEFVRASVTAIDSRDPSTAGHSLRVAKMCVKMARAVSARKETLFRGVNYSENQIKELELAGLLHDFGKVYIDPSVLLKAKKLYPMELNYLLTRIDFLKRSLELDYTRRQLELLRKDGAGTEELINALEGEKGRKLGLMEEIKEKIMALNDPTVNIEDPEKTLREILMIQDELQCRDFTGQAIPLLKPEEIENLSIKRGSLNAQERKMIEDHVEQTYKFVSNIPWPSEFLNIPEIAYKHHEKLDGSGYPGRLTAKDIPLSARMMAIADIYDALAAPDRPYKKAIKKENVFSILQYEADNGKLDPELLKVFLEDQCWQIEPEGNA